MATLKDLDELLTRLAEASAGLTLEEFKRMAIGEVSREFRGQRINVPDVRLSRKSEIAAAAQKLPTGVVAQRYGVTQSYVCRVVKRRRGV
jgi:hypothetical protein